MENSVQLLAKGIAEGELDDVETDVYMLEEDMANIQPQLDKRKTNLNKAKSILLKIEDEYTTLQCKMSDEENAQISNRITTFKRKIEQKAFTELPSAAEELSGYWDHVKKYLNDKPEPTATNSPEPTSTPAASESPEPTLTPSPTPAASIEPTETATPIPDPTSSSTSDNTGESADAEDDTNT